VSLKGVRLVPDLEVTILFAVELKYVSEVMNLIIVRAPASEFHRISMHFLSSIANAISTTFNRREALQTLPAPQNALETEHNVAIEALRVAMLPAPEYWHWPVRVSNPLVFAIRQYLTALQNHATVHFTKLLQHFVKWKARVQFPRITATEQYIIWTHFWRVSRFLFAKKREARSLDS
jgi:hypothetical protein